MLCLHTIETYTLKHIYTHSCKVQGFRVKVLVLCDPPVLRACSCCCTYVADQPHDNLHNILPPCPTQRRYILFATITMAVLVVPPITLWVDPWVWDWARIYFVVSVNFALAVYL